MNDRNRLHIIGKTIVVYLGATWVLLEALSFLIEKYQLPKGLQDILILLIVCGLPTIIIYTYFDNWRNKYALGLYAINLIVAGSFTFQELKYLHFRTDAGIPSEDSGIEIKVVAVLPFINLTGQKDMEYIVDGVHQSVTDELGSLGLFDVISAISTKKYKETELTVAEICKEVNANAVVSASVLGTSDTIRIQARLITPNPEKQVWSGTFDQATINILQLFTKVSSQIAQQIDSRFHPNKITKIPTAIKREAVHAYFKGVHHWNMLTEEDLNLALNYFKQAIEIDSNYAAAHAGIAWTWGGMCQMNFVPYELVLKNGQKSISKALELDSTQADVHRIYASFYGWSGWNWGVASKSFSKAIEINPNLADARAGYSHFLIVINQKEEAIAQIEKAIQLDPFNSRFKTFYAMILNNAREYEKVITLLTDSTGSLIESALTYSTLRTTYHLLNDHSNAIKMWQLYYQDKKDTIAHKVLTENYNQSGYKQALNELAKLLINRKIKGAYIPAWSIATILLRAGVYEESLNWLEDAYDEHSVNMPYINIDPIFDPVRDHPRFLAIHSKMNFPE